MEAATLSHEQGTRHVPSRASSCLPPRPARPAHSVSDNLIYSLTSEMTPPYIFLLLHLKNGLLWFRFFFFFFCIFLQIPPSLYGKLLPMRTRCHSSAGSLSSWLLRALRIRFDLAYLSFPCFIFIYTPHWPASTHCTDTHIVPSLQFPPGSL